MASSFPMKKNTATRIVFPIYDNDGDLVSGAAGLDSEYSLDGGAFSDCTNEATEIGSSGMYYLDLQAGETNGDVVAIIVKTTTTDAKTTALVFYTAAQTLDEVDAVADAIKAKTDNLPASPAPANEYDTEMGRIDVTLSTRSSHAPADVWSYGTRSLTDKAGFSLAADQSGVTIGTVNALAAGALADINAEIDAALADIDLDHLIKTSYGVSKPTIGSLLDLIMNKNGSQTFSQATDSLEAIRDNQAGADAAAIADAVWDEAIADHQGAGTFGAKNQKVVPSETIDDYKATGFSTHAAADVWSVVTRTLTDPDSYKADVSALALEATLTAMKGGGWTTETLKAIYDAIAALNDISAQNVWEYATRSLTDKAGFSLSSAGIDAIWADVLEGTITVAGAIRIVLAVCAGKSSGGGGASLAFRDVADTKNRLSETVDANGNRLSVTLDGT